MYSTHNEGEPVIAERFMKTLRSKIYKHLTSISKKVYTDKLDDIVDKYCRRIKMNLVDIKPSRHINSSKGINDKDPKFKVGDIFLEYQNIKAFSQKVMFQIGLKKFL